MNFGFSFVGLLFLVMLLVPNLLWSKNQPKEYEKYAKNENKTLLMLERIGEVFVCIFSLFCGINFTDLSLILIIALILMVLYEIYWIRYFRSDRTMSDMYCDMFKIPVPGASLPVFAFLLLGIVSENIFLMVFSVILAIGHIGIHLNHKNEISK